MTGHLLGYARISTTQQSLDQQRDALGAAGVHRVFADTMSGARVDRPELTALLDYAREGDTVMVVALDRLGRTVPGIFDTIAKLAAKGVHLVTIRENIDSRTAVGKLFISVFAGFAEYERTLIMERAAAARVARSARGLPVGRPRALSPEQVEAAAAMRANGASIREVSRALGIARNTLAVALQRRADERSAA